MAFAETLQRIRKANGLSQEELAYELNVTRQAVSKWESGQGYPEIEKCIQLSKLFQLSLDELLAETDQPLRREIREEVGLPIDDDQPSLVNMFKPQMDWEQVDEYIHSQKCFANRLSFAIFVIITSVSFTLLLTEELGTPLMLVGIGIGVFIIVFSSMNHKELPVDKDHPLELDMDLREDITLMEKQDRTPNQLRLAAGIMMIIIAVAIPLGLDFFFTEMDAHYGLMFPIIGFGVFLIVSSAIRMSIYETLLGKKEN